MKKIIIFDVDGVITESGASKEQIIVDIFQKHDLYNISGVPEILSRGLNRIIALDLIYEIQPFDKQEVLNDINMQLAVLEKGIGVISDTYEFIRDNHEKYTFFTNTSLPKRSLQEMFTRLDLGKYFMELLAYDDGSKKENVEYVMEVYNTKPENILFIDDNISHIEAVKSTGVHCLHFIQDGVSLEQKISKLFN